jgi:hypothetical protein
MRAKTSWAEANQGHLLAGLADVRALLEAHIRTRGGEDSAKLAAAESVWDGPGGDALEGGASLDALCAAFGLSAFERRLLLLCAGMELDAAFAPLCAAAQGDLQRPFPTFSLALAALPDAHWSAVTPASPLRLWRLVDVLPGDSLTSSPLRVDEWVLHFLAGVAYLDERLSPLMQAVDPPAVLTPTHLAAAERIAELWAEQSGERPVVLLSGDDVSACRAVAAGACDLLGVSACSLRVGDIASSAVERDLLGRVWEREAVLGGRVLLVDCQDADAEALRAATLLVEAVRTPVMVIGREPLRLRERARFQIEVTRPGTADQVLLWRAALGGASGALNGEVEEVAEHFQLGVDGIRTAGAQARGEARRSRGLDAPPTLWNICRVQARARLDDLAQRIEPAAGWDDLVLPAPQKEILRQIAANAAQRVTVYERWGFAGQGSRGLGITAVFTGASGTGKTMAAEVLAGQLSLDLYRIDLSQVVSKYIGETEKNLGRVFDAAEEGGAVLLFDEADALFGKRTEVKDSHDRYANIEVSYLLQRMEAYRGLAILTTNLKSALDPAFLRRIRFVIQFPFPDAAQRSEIWRRVFPAAAPTEGLDADRLARLNVAGGNIRNIALNGAFLAAAAGQPVRMEHLLRAAQAEYAKLERPLTDSEVVGWR